MTVMSTKLRRLLADWEARRHARFPRRSDFQPADIRYVLGLTSLIDIRRDPLRFFCRLHGSNQVMKLGFDITGKYIDEAPNKTWAKFAQKHLAEVATTGEPTVKWYLNRVLGDQIWNSEALVLPLSRDGMSLDMLMNTVVHHRVGQRDKRSKLLFDMVSLELDG